MTIKMVCISDTHCQLSKIKLPDGDILVHSGDALSRGTLTEFTRFINKMGNLAQKKYEKVIYTPGNHDIITEENESLAKQMCAERGVIYLNDSGIKIDDFNFWGSAVTPRFHDWAWNRDLEQDRHNRETHYLPFKAIQDHWDLIPDDTNVLITHGPPKGFLDISVYSGVHCGCPQLLEKISNLKNLKYHVFGHIHNWHGIYDLGNGTKLVNASNCTESYKPTNPPIVVDL